MKHFTPPASIVVQDTPMGRFDQLLALIQHQVRNGSDVLLDKSDVQVLVAGVRRLRTDLKRKRHRMAPRRERVTTAAVRTILDTVARDHKVRVQEICGPRRTKRHVGARHEAIRLIHEACPELSTPDIASIFGLDHTSVIYVLGRKGLGRLAA